ncbi:ABC transporter ATP-binding protein [Gordonia soli]|uniref:Putative iron-siderophore ABC transporter ATP-binding protein n=1 Tax=Gordonia soli NBRC 108243 TaxID=1223545 RepID=M0QEH1_9ACTN|nr:ABC transporter ATP-binding protein [Gordonia soli]GAC66834.1 putative iron-siderophore ABC transporter ATP-binding protein [Gordonia soli NBRC 108243]
MSNPLRLVGEQLELRYDKTPVVHGVSVTLRAGQITVVLGANGSGKSTVLRSLARLHPIADGGVSIGRSLESGTETESRAHLRDATLLSPREFAARVTLFAQIRATPQGLSVRDVVAFGRHPHRHRFARLTSADNVLIDEAMNLTGVSSFASRGVQDLSGGEMQRVWLAACLAQNTDIVLLDEPTNHLDLRYQVEVLDLIEDLAHDHGVAVGLVLHDLDQAAQIADNVVLLCGGRVHRAGPVAEVLTSANLTEVYQIPIEVSRDADTGRLRIDALGRRDRQRQRQRQVI